MELRRLLRIIGYALKTNSVKRAKYAKKKKIFGLVGEDVRLPFMILPLRCENIFFHNNIEVASGVKFVPHDAIHEVLNRINGNKNIYKESIKRIEIMNNVFIGANSIILGGVTIGNNVVVGAGSVVTKDIPDGSVVAGVPAKVIGSFDELMNKRKN